MTERYDDELRFDFVRTLTEIVSQHYRTAAAVLLVVGGVAAAIIAVVFLAQETQRITIVEYRPTFAGASSGQYRNEMPYSPSDVIAAPVLDPVYERNGISAYCNREAFKSGFLVERHSAEYGSLIARFEGLLSETRLTSVDRSRLEAEFESRRAALPLQYRLSFQSAIACKSMPPEVISKALHDTLDQWADQSKLVRGALSL